MIAAVIGAAFLFLNISKINNWNTIKEKNKELKELLSICDKIQRQYWKDSCYRDVASAKQDPSICDKIQDQDEKDWCYRDIAKAKQDLSICDKMQDQDYKDYCYSDVALAKQDLSIYDKIQDQDIKNKTENNSNNARNLLAEAEQISKKEGADFWCVGEYLRVLKKLEMAVSLDKNIIKDITENKIIKDKVGSFVYYDKILGADMDSVEGFEEVFRN